MAGIRPRWSPLVWVRVFLTRVVRNETGCWVWTGLRAGRIDTGGQYGWVRKDGRMQYAHRAYYEHDRGPVPDGLELDHLCRNRLCVNPDHLEPVTHSVNVTRGDMPNAQKTHCPAGHPYDEANTFMSARGDGRLKRNCRTCVNARKVERRRLAAVGV